jgi:hypothetical protein
MVLLPPMETKSKNKTSEPPLDLDTELRLIEEAKNKLLSGVKTKLAKELTAAAITLETLTRNGVTNIFKEPEFADVVKAFRIGQPDATPVKPVVKEKAPKGDGAPRIYTHDAIMQAMADGVERGPAALLVMVEEIKGSVSKVSISQALAKLVKENKLVNTGRGLYRKA